MILYLPSDLAWATRIKGAADALNLPARPVRSLDMLDARLADSPVRALVVDLDHPEPDLCLAALRRVAAHNKMAAGQATARPDAGADAPGAPAAAGASGTIRTLAFAPHVHADLMQQARDAGADDVLTRGAFANGLPGILQRISTPAGG